MISRTVWVAMCVAMALGSVAAAQPAPQGARPARRAFDLTTPRPIPARDSVWIEELTWMEVRDAMAAGRPVAAGSSTSRMGHTCRRASTSMCQATARRCAQPAPLVARSSRLIARPPGHAATAPGAQAIIETKPKVRQSPVADVHVPSRSGEGGRCRKSGPAAVPAAELRQRASAGIQARAANSLIGRSSLACAGSGPGSRPS
jgi:hypothetical protein